MADLTRVDLLERRLEDQSRHWDHLFGEIGPLDHKMKTLGATLSARIDTLGHKFDRRIEALEQKFDCRFETVDREIDDLRSELSKQFSPGTEDCSLLAAVLQRLTSGPVVESNPLWSPDGRHVAYSVNNSQIFRKPIDASTPEQILLKGDTPGNFPQSWTTDGRLMVYQRGIGQGFNDLWALPLDGDRQPKPVIETPFDSGAGDQRHACEGSAAIICRWRQPACGFCNSPGTEDCSFCARIPTMCTNPASRRRYAACSHSLAV